MHMQITVSQFKKLVYTAHQANKKHKNLHTVPFKQTREDIVTFARANINWRSYIPETQATTVEKLMLIDSMGFDPAEFFG